MERVKMLIGGRWKTAEKELKVFNPYNGNDIGSTWLAGGSELRDSVDCAATSFEELRYMPAWKKSEVLQKVVKGIEERSEELARTIALEAGKPIRDSRAEVARSQATFRIASEECKRLGGEVLPLDIAQGAEGRFGIIRRFPVGVVLGVAPFNFPLNLVAHKIAPAMACGNPIILKPASKTPLTALKLGEIITDAGWPAGGVNIVPASGADTEKLLSDERIKKLTFTGSPAVGWRLKATAARMKVTLELGGNAGVIVHDDADLELAAKRCVAGAFSFAGQVCISVQRIFVQRMVFDRFRDMFLEHCGRLRLGDPLDEATDIGPMIDEDAARGMEGVVKEAVDSGARVLFGGSRRGSLLEPTVVTDTRPHMKICCEEAFAPVVVLEAYDDFDSAISEVNRGVYGLQAGVFTKDMSRILKAYERLEVGGVIANDIPTFRVDNMPYGGVKSSGFGREGVRYAIDEMTELKLLALRP